MSVLGFVYQLFNKVWFIGKNPMCCIFFFNMTIKVLAIHHYTFIQLKSLHQAIQF